MKEVNKNTPLLYTDDGKKRVINTYGSCKSEDSVKPAETVQVGKENASVVSGVYSMLKKLSFISSKYNSTHDSVRQSESMSKAYNGSYQDELLNLTHSSIT